MSRQRGRFMVIGVYSDGGGRFADAFIADDADGAEAAAQSLLDDGLTVAAVIEVTRQNDAAGTFTGRIVA